jgi:hypothetical protein
MTDVEFDITLTGAADSGALFDPLEVEMLLESTKQHLTEHILERLGDSTCDLHGKGATVRVVGTYDQDSEQIDFAYDIQACCNLMIMRAAGLLSH